MYACCHMMHMCCLTKCMIRICKLVIFISTWHVLHLCTTNSLHHNSSDKYINVCKWYCYECIPCVFPWITPHFISSHTLGAACIQAPIWSHSSFIYTRPRSRGMHADSFRYDWSFSCVFIRTLWCICWLVCFYDVIAVYMNHSPHS
jgi:hypothetical protein